MKRLSMYKYINIKIYLTRDYKYISHVTKHAEYIKIRVVNYDKTKV